MKINKELRGLIPPLTDDERKLLEESILTNGCRDAIIVWDGTIIDGHNRFDICKQNDISFDILDMEFDSIEDVKVWMIDNQKARRNLTDGWKYELAQVKKAILLEKGREKQAETLGGYKHKASVLSTIDKTEPGISPLSTIDKPDSHNTRNEIAASLGWSTGKVAIADKVWGKAEPELKEKIKAGEVTFNQVYQDLKKEEKIEKRKSEIENIKAKIENENTTIEGLFDVVVVDPPWAYGREYDPQTSRVANPYPEMTTSEISKIELPLKENAVLFLWTTHAFIQDAFWLLKEWGLTYKATLVWDKEQMGMGANVRMQCEFCLLAVKGKPFLNGSSERDIIRAKRREHSRKPNEFYEFVDRLCIGRKLDYFSREKRLNWNVYGAETEKF